MDNAEIDWDKLNRLNYEWEYFLAAFKDYQERFKSLPCMSELWDAFRANYDGDEVLDRAKFFEDLKFLDYLSNRKVLLADKNSAALGSFSGRKSVDLSKSQFWGRERPALAKVKKFLVR